MLNEYGIGLWLNQCGNTIEKVRVTTNNGIQNINVNNKLIKGDILTVGIILSGLNTIITKMELIDTNGKVIGVRNDNIRINTEIDRLFNFSFRLISK